MQDANHDQLRNLVKEFARGIDSADGRNDGIMTRAGYGEFVTQRQRSQAGVEPLEIRALEIVNQLRGDTNHRGEARRPTNNDIDAYFDAEEVTRQALQSLPNPRGNSRQ
jgi:hypothetical protein